MTSRLRDLPSVDSVLSNPLIRTLGCDLSHEALVGLVRDTIQAARSQPDISRAPAAATVAYQVARAAAALLSWPRDVINATGVVLHTNLGRAPLSAAATEAAARAAAGYTDLEYDLEDGRRGSRQAAVADLVRCVTGAEAALVVNNNASAMLLGLMALAQGREVIISRSEAVEIGGGFRIPDVLSSSGAQLVEVGTTNRTYVRDYETAISDRTGAILTVHASNFRTIGFTHSPPLQDLVKLGRKHGLPVLHDLGSGCLLDTSEFGLAHEPTVQESLAAGIDLAFFSGDKLLGGPQSGIIAGRGEMVGRLAAHPVARAVRADKLSLAALAATLAHYMRGEAMDKIPVWRMISASPEDLKERARWWNLDSAHPSALVESRSAIGGGSLPGETLPSWSVSIDTGNREAATVAAWLRHRPDPIVTRIEGGRLLLDPRTVLTEQDERVSASLRLLPVRSIG